MTAGAATGGAGYGGARAFPSRRDALRVRTGILFLLASGVFSTIGLPLRGPIVLPEDDPALWARVALMDTHDLAWALLLPSLVIQCFGFLALYAYVADTQQDGIAFWGAMLSIAGNGLFLPFAGILAFVDPAIAQLYQAGDTGVLAVASAGVQAPLSGALLALSGLLLLAGSILVSLLLWRSPLLPTWTALPYFYHALALTVLAPLSYAVERSGALVLLVVTIAIARAVWTHTRPSRTRTGGAS